MERSDPKRTVNRSLSSRLLPTSWSARPHSSMTCNLHEDHDYVMESPKLTKEVRPVEGCDEKTIAEILEDKEEYEKLQEILKTSTTHMAARHHFHLLIAEKMKRNMKKQEDEMDKGPPQRDGRTVPQRSTSFFNMSISNLAGISEKDDDGVDDGVDDGPQSRGRRRPPQRSTSFFSMSRSSLGGISEKDGGGIDKGPRSRGRLSIPEKSTSIFNMSFSNVGGDFQ